MKNNSVQIVRQQILDEMYEPEIYNNMTDEEMLADLDANVFASHADEVVVDWRDRLREAMDIIKVC